jgi:hypothetical protein
LQPNVKVVPVAAITGASVSTFQVTVRVTVVAGFPQSSDTLNDLVCDFVHVPLTVPSLADTAPTEQLSVAVAVPSAAIISSAVGLQPNVKVVPVAVITGASVSSVQVTVRVTVSAGFPQASETLNVLVCDFVHVPLTAPSEKLFRLQ